MLLMRPISVAAPVAADHAARLSVYHQRAGVGHASAVADHGLRGDRRDVLFHGLRFAGQRGFIDAQLARLEQAQIGGHFVAGGEQHDVADYHLFRRDLAALAVAQHRRIERQHVADGVQRALGLAFLDHADDGVDQHHANDHAAIHPMGEQCGDQRGSQQHVDEDVVELAGETDQQAVMRCGGQQIRAMELQALLCLGGRKSAGLGCERVQHSLCRQAVPIGCGCRGRVLLLAHAASTG